MWNKPSSFCLSALALLVGVSAAADSMLVPTVELREEAPGRYVLEAVAAPAIVAGIGTPMPPDGCSVGGQERSEVEKGIRLRYAIDCADERLGRRDVLVLPWVVDGIQLTAHWSDGTSRRALFGREQDGVVVRLSLILDREEILTDLVATHGRAGWIHFWASGTHVLFFVALALLGRVSWIGLGGLVAGHAVALIVTDAGVPGLARAPADAALAGAAALLMAAVIGDGVASRDLFAMSTVLGLLHGLGVAGELTGSGLSTSAQTKAVFLFNSGLDVGGAVLLAVAVAARSLLESQRERLVWVVGVMGVFFLFVAMRQALAPTARASGVEASFMEVDAQVSSTRVSAPNLAAPPAQLDAKGQLASPFMSYLIVEPYQIRHEVLVDVSATRNWLDVPVDSGSHIPVDAQEALTDAVSELVSTRAPVTIDERLGRLAASRADFVVLGPTGAVTRETAIPEAVAAAVVGVTLVYETETIADSVTLDWDLFSEAVETVPLAVTDPVAAVDSELTPEAPRFEWRNTVGDFELPTIEAVRAPKPRVPLLSLGLGVIAVGVLLVARKRRVATMCLVAGYVAYPFARTEASIPIGGGPSIDRAEAAGLVEALLTNVYRCFDIPDENRLYDRLALTVTGEQLLEVYLESRRALEIEGSGGALVRIDEVVVKAVRGIREVDNGGYRLDTLWTVGGSVNHFGHIHFRQNEYDAIITIVPVDGAWKIGGLVLMGEERLL